MPVPPFDVVRFRFTVEFRFRVDRVGVPKLKAAKTRPVHTSMKPKPRILFRMTISQAFSYSARRTLMIRRIRGVCIRKEGG
jgi:hypothetical protein